MIKFDRVKIIFIPCLILLLFTTACLFKDEESYFQRADSYFEQGQAEKAVGVLKEYLEEFPNGTERDRALFRTGEILYYTQGKRGQAVEAFGRLIKDHSFSRYGLQAREFLAGIYRDETNDYLRAVFEYRWLLKQKPGPGKAAGYQYQVAHCYFLANRYEEAIEELKLFIERYPESSLTEPAFNELGSIYLIQGKVEQALEVFKTMLAKFPSSPYKPEIEFKIGDSYELLGLLKEALAQYKEVRPRYGNKSAVDIRIRGVEVRLKDIEGPAKISRTRPAKKTRK